MDFEHTKKTKDLMSIVADFINTHIKPAESIYAEEMETYRRKVINGVFPRSSMN